jgi:parallel beta-helix repeat protein
MDGRIKILKRLGLLLAVALFFALPAKPTMAQTGTVWSVCLEGTCDFNTIQSAIDAASAGDTIEVSAGTYTYETEGSPAPTGLIKVTKPLSIKAADGTRPVIDASGIDGAFKIYSTTFSGGQVLIEGFDITGDSTTDIAITAPMHDSGDPTKIIIRDNIIHGMDGGIDFWGSGLSGAPDNERVVNNVEITANEFYNLGQDGAVGFGIMLEDLKDGVQFAALVEDNLFKQINNGDTDTGAGIVIPRADVENGEAVNARIAANTFESTVPLGVAVLAGDVSPAEIVDNTFDGAGIVVENISAGPLNVYFNWWGSVAGPEDDQVGDDVAYNPWCYTDECTEFYLGETGSIQDGINVVAAGDTLHVAPGTYEEKLVIDKPLTLLGPNAGKAGYASDRVNEAIITFPDGLPADLEHATAKVESDGVTIDGFKFVDKDYLQALMPYHIYTLDANNLIIQNNLFIGTELPIYRDYTGPEANFGWEIKNNKMVGGPFVNSHRSRGMYIWQTAATISYNVIEGYGVGIQISPNDEPTGGVVENNTIAAGHSGLYHNVTHKGSGAWLYSGNTITVAPNDRTAQNFYTPIAPEEEISFRAIYIRDFGNTGTGDLPSVSFTNNTADLAPETGSYLIDRFAIFEKESADGTAATVENNAFTNYSIAADSTATSVDASPNWWGNATGPEAEQVVGSVKYNPWCYNAECTEFYLGETGSIQEGIDSLAGENTLHVAPGTYNEQISITKPFILVGENKDTTIIDGGGDGVVVTIQAVGVRFSGFTVQNSGDDDQTDAGVGVAGVSGVTISDNILRDNANGVALAAASNNTVENNTFEDNYIGVAMEGYPDSDSPSTTNTIQNNEISDSTHSGIYGGQNCDGNTISGNTITSSAGAADGIYLWKSSENTITNNLITDNPQYGFHLFGSSNNNVIQNTITGNLDGIRIRHSLSYASTPNTIEENKIFDNSQYGVFAETEITDVELHLNWWGSAGGPEANKIVEHATFIPWCGDEDCTTTSPNNDEEIELPPEADEEDVQTAINNAPSGSTVVIPPGSYTTTNGFVVNSSGVTIFLREGTKIQNNSPCFTISASNTTVTAETLGGAVCVPTDGSNGIDVNTGLTNITIEGFEIDGSDQTTGDGINVAGEITNLVVRDMYIHDLDGDAIDLVAQPTGTVEIKGNLFMDNVGVGVRNDTGLNGLDVKYNAWGDMAGPKGAEGDDVGENLNYDSWTHADLYMESSGTTTPDEVEPNEQITYTVYANMENVMGTTFTLKYPSANLTYIESETVLSGTFDTETLTPNVADGTLTFKASNATVPVEAGEEIPLFSVTFEAGEAAGEYSLDLDETTDEFVMQASSGSSDNIYPTKLVDNNVTVTGDFLYIFPIFFH